MKTPIEISNGHDTVKIYTGASRGRAYYQISFYRAGRRERRTFSDKNAAKQEAKVILGQLASQGEATEEAITTTDIESLVAARAALDGLPLPLHLAVEGFAGAIRQLGTPADPVAALHRAAAFYIKHHPVGSLWVPLAEMTRFYRESRERIGVSKAWIAGIKSAMKGLLMRFPGDECDLPSGQDVARWLDDKYQSPVTKNSALKTLKAFAAWSVKERLVGSETITGVEFWKKPTGAIEIYTPEELRIILSRVPEVAIPFVVIGAFAGLRAAEVSRLDWSEVNLERGFIMVAASKAKTAARRLVPISENLKAWLQPRAMESGAVVPLSVSRINQILSERDLPRKRNALRHSYISYRLAVVHDTPRVALECGNSPAIIFKHYRELVAPEAAKAWFDVAPNQPKSPAPEQAVSEKATTPVCELKAA